MSKTAFYSGSFDPVTLGHMDIITRAITLFDKLIIGIGVHHGKKPMFSEADRREMLLDETQELALETGKTIEIISFGGLVVDAARQHGAQVILRGLRDSDDFTYETQMAGMNKSMAPDMDTVFLISSPQYKHIASKFVRQITALKGDVSPFVPDSVHVKLQSKYI